ncbi:MAG: FliM/FliN family flagellar motor switch protein [SAR324 cluster bacterium]|nr:FliM/FliN family flagellar motor switch protein [SAR324 cluster bacterium]
MAVEKYLFGEAERIRYGRFPVLDTVLYRWARKIEETLFEHFQIEMYAGSSVVEEMKFSAFYGSLMSPRPIYLFELEPLQGQGLFVLDNRFAQLCLNEGGSGELQQLGPENQQRLQKVVQQMMADLDESWASVLDVQTHLRKVTTYLFRARILNAFEPCLVAQIHLSGSEVSARLTWCFPRVMLEPVLETLGTRPVIPSLYANPAHAEPGRAERFMQEMNYDLRINLGALDISRATAGLNVGSILPLSGGAGNEAVIKVNGTPLLVGNVGQIQGRYAVQVTGAYTEKPELPRKLEGAFQSIEWPRAITE